MNKITRAIEAVLRHSDQVMIDDLVKNVNVSRLDAVAAAKALEAAGAGTFVVGRKGHPSRFVRKDTPTTLHYEPAPMHHIAIRAGVTVAVPSDMTKDEAQQFIDVLSALVINSKRRSGTYAKVG